MISLLPVLARYAFWNPRFVVWISALSDFTGVLPVPFGPCVSTAWAVGLPGWWSFGIRTNTWTPRMGPRHLAGVDWVRLNAGAEVETQALVAVLVRQRVLRVEVARIDQVDSSLIVEGC